MVDKATMSALNRVSQSWKNPTITKKKVKHKKLDEDWFDISEPIKDGMTFSAKYLGMTLVASPKGEGSTSAAIKRILELTKVSNSKLQKVQLTVSTSGIKVHDQTGAHLIDDFSVYRISFCASVEQHNKIFSFVAQNSETQTMECHAYLCNTTKEAQALTVTVAQSFKIAFELWEDEGMVNQAENDTLGSDIKVINGESKTNPVVISSVLEKRYKRLSSGSNPFDTTEEDVSLEEDVKDVKSKGNEQESGNAKSDFNDTFIFTPTQTSAIQKPIAPIRPPPANTRQSDKPSPRRSNVRPSSMGQFHQNSSQQTLQTPSPSATTPDVEDWDQGFADLALSRTRTEKRNPKERSSSETAYPTSNPFFSPSNPFCG